MAWRDVIGRYKGSVLGVLWSFVTPLFMLAVYTFVFSVVFKARWTESAVGGESKVEFALVLFTGLIVHGLFAEMLNKAPTLILSNSNYVKKVVFPLEILPFVSLFSSLFHCAASLLVLLVASLFVYQGLPWTVLLTPLVFAPLAILALGCSWVLASLGVFIRDIGQAIGLLTTVLLFVSPIFFPLSAIPEDFRLLVAANPLTFIIEQARNVLLWGRMPDWMGLLVYTAVSSLLALLGYAWFQKTRKGFADVL